MAMPALLRRGLKVIIEAGFADSNIRWCSDGVEFRCDDGTPLRVTFALDCCDREAISWATTTGGHSGHVVRDVMLAAFEQRFGTTQATQTIEWLSDNGSAYIVHSTRSFARELGLELLNTPVRSPQSNGMVKSLVKTIKHNCVACMDKSDVPTALSRLAIAFEHYNERHPHEALNTARLASPNALRCHQPNSVPCVPNCRGNSTDNPVISEKFNYETQGIGPLPPATLRSPLAIHPIVPRALSYVLKTFGLG